MLDKLSTDDLTSAGQLIGKTAEFDSSVSGMTATNPAEWRWTFSTRPASVEAEILDGSGAVVARPAMTAATSGTFAWDGMLPSGARAADGAYVLKLTARTASGDTVSATLTSLGKVQEVVSREGELWAGLGGVALPMNKLTRIAG